MQSQTAVSSPVNSPASSANHYKFVRKLGRGTHGTVSLAKDVTTDTYVAVKAVKRKDKKVDRYRQLLQQSNKNPAKTLVANNIGANEQRIRREIAVMRRLNHSNIVHLIEVLDDPLEKKVYIILEYMGGGEIEWRDGGGQPTQTVLQATRVIRDVMLGLRYIHLQGIVHRDIKPANILWTSDKMTVKISDFGVSLCTFVAANRPDGQEETPEDVELYSDKFLNGVAGTPAFLSPENCPTYIPSDSSVREASDPSLDKPPTPVPPFATDIWALGVTYYCLLFGHPPWEDSNEYRLYNKIVQDDFVVPLTMGFDTLPTGGRSPISEQQFRDGVPVLKILNGLLQKNPSQRMSLLDLKKMPYLTKDIRDPDRWQRETAVQAGEPIRITEEDEKAAFTPVHWKSKVALGIGRIKSKLGRQQTTPQQLLEHSVRSHGVKASTLRNPVQSRNGHNPPELPLLRPLSPASATPNPIHCRPANEILLHGNHTLHLFTVRTRSESGVSRQNEASGLRQRMKGIIQSRNKQSPPSPQVDLPSTNRCVNLPQDSSNGAWAASHDDREAMSMRQATSSDYEHPDDRLVLTEGGDNFEDFSEGWSDDDYGETEHERLQRELVGAGGLNRPQDTSRLWDTVQKHLPLGNRERNGNANNRGRLDEDSSDDEDADDEEDEDDEEDDDEAGDSDAGGRPVRSAYSSSEQPSSDEEDQVSPVEVRLRRPTMSSPIGSPKSPQH